MDPDKIIIEDLNHLFEYEKLSREIDSIDDINTVRKFAKAYIKLYMKQQEVVSQFWFLLLP